jgi:hypothetical protein
MINFKSPEEIRKENVASLQKFKPNPNNREIKKRNIFRHFKGHIYEIMNIGKDSETQEDVVIYENMETGDIWVRPLKMFLEPVDKQKYRYL